MIVNKQTGSGGGGSYTLPTATSSRLGGVKIGSGITVQNDGTISVTGGTGGGSAYSLSDMTQEQRAEFYTAFSAMTDEQKLAVPVYNCGIALTYKGIDGGKFAFMGSEQITNGVGAPVIKSTRAYLKSDGGIDYGTAEEFPANIAFKVDIRNKNLTNPGGTAFWQVGRAVETGIQVSVVLVSGSTELCVSKSAWIEGNDNSFDGFIGANFDYNEEEIRAYWSFHNNSATLVSWAPANNYRIVDDLSAITTPYEGMIVTVKPINVTYTGRSFDITDMVQEEGYVVRSLGTKKFPDVLWNGYEFVSGFFNDGEWHNDLAGETQPAGIPYYIIYNADPENRVFKLIQEQSPFPGDPWYMEVAEGVVTAETTYTKVTPAETYIYANGKWNEFPSKSLIINEMTQAELADLYKELVYYFGGPAGTLVRYNPERFKFYYKVDMSTGEDPYFGDTFSAIFELMLARATMDNGGTVFLAGLVPGRYDVPGYDFVGVICIKKDGTVDYQKHTFAQSNDTMLFPSLVYDTTLSAWTRDGESWDAASGCVRYGFVNPYSLWSSEGIGRINPALLFRTYDGDFNTAYSYPTIKIKGITPMTVTGEDNEERELNQQVILKYPDCTLSWYNAEGQDWVYQLTITF